MTQQPPPMDPFDVENLRLQNSPDEALRAYGRFRARVGKQIRDHVVGERVTGRTSEQILADYILLAAREHGVYLGSQDITREVALDRAQAAAKQFLEWTMSTWTEIDMLRREQKKALAPSSQAKATPKKKRS